MKANPDAMDKLRDLAELILYHKRHRRHRPIVIEFSGSPKSGKSSCCGALDLFLRRNGFNTRMISEKSHFAKIRDKRNSLFNLWTMSSTIADLSEILGTACSCNSPDVILIDRGLFDALCWFHWLSKNNKLSEEDFNNFKNFILSPKWIEMIDLVFVFTAKPQDSIKREFSELLTDIRGSIMEESILGEVIESINHCKNAYGSQFKAIDSISTSNSNRLADFNLKVAQSVLTILGRGVEEKVAYVNKSQLEKNLPDIFRLREAGFSYQDIAFGPRHKIEADVTKVQLVPICIFVDKKKQLLLSGQKSKVAAEKGNPEHGKMLIYFGGHVRIEDVPRATDQNLVGILERALARELKEELEISVSPRFSLNSRVIWIKNSGRTEQHLAICSVIQVDSGRFDFKSDIMEFSKDEVMSVCFRKIEDFSSHYFELEEWGRAILTNIGKVEFKKNISGIQLPLFDEEDFFP